MYCPRKIHSFPLEMYHFHTLQLFFRAKTTYKNVVCLSGKTVTIVEAIHQLKKRTNAKILVCAPANAACNMLTEKLSKFCTPKELRRIMSESADYESMHENIVPYCNLCVVDGRTHHLPFVRSQLSKFRIVVTTLVFVGKYTR